MLPSPTPSEAAAAPAPIWTSWTAGPERQPGLLQRAAGLLAEAAAGRGEVGGEGLLDLRLVVGAGRAGGERH